MSEETRLNEFNRDEWHDVARILKPDWTEKQFDEAWEEFLEMKRRKASQ